MERPAGRRLPSNPQAPRQRNDNERDIRLLCVTSVTSASQGGCRRNEQKETESIRGGEGVFGKMNSKRGEAITLASTVEFNYPKRYPFEIHEAVYRFRGNFSSPKDNPIICSVVRFSISLYHSRICS